MRGPALALAAALALTLTACGEEFAAVPSPGSGTSTTPGSAQVSRPADAAAADDRRPGAGVANRGTVTVDGRVVPVDTTGCAVGPTVTAVLADGGELEVTATEGGVGVTLTLVGAPGPGTWADDQVDLGTSGRDRSVLTGTVAVGSAPLAATDGSGEVDVTFDLRCR